jgi:predicted MFS family arabinose efflux permease
VLLFLFVINEARARQPITPLALFADRGRSGSFVSRLLIVAGMFGMFFFLTQFVQNILGFSPLQAGLSFLPMTAALFAVSRLSPRLLARFGSRPLMIVGLLPVVAGMAWLSRISPATGYLSGVLGPMLLIGGGMGVVFVPLTMASLAGVRPQDSGAASSMVNVTQQIGGSLGLAILVTAFSTASKNAAQHPVAHLTRLAQQHQAVVHGMSSAFTLAVVFDVLALLIVLVIIRDRARPRAEAVAQPADRVPQPAD